ncbi:MAG TPA: MerR family transcriptional regulator [Pyrinomonadaceae bacterium]|nr:MerR family transcriptional regulator [Pyrinomonadaceae bacterium]
MGQAAVMIPEKIYFKIGEVCEIVGVQAHVLRYWETEFPMLSPQKNRSGQRSYRRRDVEISLRIKQLLYDEMFTIAGARKKLQSEMRETPKLKIVHPEPAGEELSDPTQTPSLFNDPSLDELELDLDSVEPKVGAIITEQREAIKKLGAQLLELREMLKTNQNR